MTNAADSFVKMPRQTHLRMKHYQYNVVPVRMLATDVRYYCQYNCKNCTLVMVVQIVDRRFWLN